MEMLSAIDEVQGEILKATDAFGPFNSVHESYGVLSEEMYELIQAIHLFKTHSEPDAKAALREEYRQIAAMAIRSMMDLV
jgi:hypothetical protein